MTSNKKLSLIRSHEEADVDPKVARSLKRYEKQYRRLAYKELPDNVPLEALKWDLSNWTIIMSDQCIRSLMEREDTCIVEHLDLAGADKITNVGLELFMNGMPKLTNVSLENAFQITAKGLTHMLKSCPSLRHLNLTGCLGISGTGFARLGQDARNLVQLALSGCTQVTPWAFMKIFQGCSLLQDLDLSFCSLITDQEIKFLADCCNSIELLNLKECRQISDISILSLSKGSGTLKGIGLSRHDLVSRITDISLLALAEGCPELKVIDFSGCEMISDVGVSWLAKGCKKLETINFTNCTKVTNAGMRYLSEECKEIRTVVLKNVKQISDLGVRHLATSCPRLESINASGLCLLTDGVQRDFGHEGLQSLANEDSIMSMKRLNLHGCFRVCRVALSAISSLHSLESLALSGCTSLSFEGISAIAKSCVKLFHLSLAGCGECVSDSMITAISSFEKLKILDLSDCNKIGRRGCKSLSRCSALSSLNLSGCSNVCNEAILMLGEGNFLPGLRELFLNRCPKVNDTALIWIADSFKDSFTSSGIVTLTTLALKGTKVSLRALKAIEGYFLYSSLKTNSTYLGFLALSRAKDRRIINAHSNRSDSIALIQAVIRARRCRLIVGKARLQHHKFQEGTKIVAMCRGFLARSLAKQYRKERWNQRIAAIQLQCFARLLLAKNRVYKLKHSLWKRIGPIKAISIQRIFRGYRGRKIAIDANLARTRRQIAQVEASIKIQCCIRRSLAAIQFKMLEENANLQVRKRVSACIVVQTFWRSELAGQKMNELRLNLFRLRQRQSKAAKIITAQFKKNHIRACMQRRIVHTRCLNDKGTMIQVWYRRKLEEARSREERQLQVRATRNKATVLIQSLARARSTNHILQQLRVKQKQTEILQHRNATVVACCCRLYLSKIRVDRLRQERKKLFTLHFSIMTRAAIQIEAFWRGCIGRKYAKFALQKKKSRWKQLWSKEDEVNFYYNQVTGESRWKKPQELLDLERRPTCSNCAYYDAQIECSNCDETFCGTCWEAIHYGGKRKHHTFRTLYDYYNRRIEYDYDEFPSLLPSAVENDNNGWHLRVG